MMNDDVRRAALSVVLDESRSTIEGLTRALGFARSDIESVVRTKDFVVCENGEVTLSESGLRCAEALRAEVDGAFMPMY